MNKLFFKHELIVHIFSFSSSSCSYFLLKNFPNLMSLYGMLQKKLNFYNYDLRISEFSEWGSGLNPAAGGQRTTPCSTS